jgi:hypothetical protein
MNFLRLLVPVLLFCALAVPAVAGADEEPGYYIVRITDSSCGCPRDGGMVYFDDIYMGNITGGRLAVELAAGEPPFTKITIVREMFETYHGLIDRHPAPGETVDLVIPLLPVTNKNSTGYYIITCPVDGADVLVDNVYAGSISSGELAVPVPAGDWTCIAISVIKPGYTAYNLTLTARPSPGGTLQVYAPIEARSTQDTAAATGQETPQAGFLFPALSAFWGIGIALAVVRREKGRR